MKKKDSERSTAVDRSRIQPIVNKGKIDKTPFIIL